MMQALNIFLRKEDGAVTVDWVVLAAATVGLAAAVTIAILGGTESVGDSVKVWLSSRQVGS